MFNNIQQYFDSISIYIKLCLKPTYNLYIQIQHNRAGKFKKYGQKYALEVRLLGEALKLKMYPAAGPLLPQDSHCSGCSS